jgi:hypothetical protein
MKNLILVFALLIGTSIYAQDPVKDKMKETKVKTIKVEENGKMVEKKVKVTTEQEQKIKTKIDSNHYENSNRISTPIKVTKTISIDNDNDPFYDSETNLMYYTSKENDYEFSRNKSGFVIMTSDGDKNTMFGNARLTSNKRYYLLNTNNYSGIGYFNAEGDFVVEYYDDVLGAMVIQTFGQSKL